MQEVIFKINTVKKLLNYTLKWCLKYGNYDIIKQKTKKVMKHVKNVAQSLYLRPYKTNNIAMS